MDTDNTEIDNQNALRAEQNDAKAAADKKESDDRRQAFEYQNGEEQEPEEAKGFLGTLVDILSEKVNEIISPNDATQQIYQLEERLKERGADQRLAGQYVAGDTDIEFNEDADLDTLADELAAEGRANVNTANVGMQGEDIGRQWEAEQAANQAADRAGLDFDDEAGRASVEAAAQGEADKAAEELAAEEQHPLAGVVDISSVKLDSFTNYDEPGQQTAQAAGPQLVTTPPAPAPEQEQQAETGPEHENPDMAKALAGLYAAMETAQELTGVDFNDFAQKPEGPGTGTGRAA